MKSSLALLVLWFLAAIALRAEGLVLRSPAHPRLYFTAQRVTALQERLTREPGAQESWKGVLSAAERAAAKAEVSSAEVEPLALAFRMTGESRYAAALREYLRRELRRSEWSGPEMARRTPPWHADLAVARTLFATSVAFDSIHDFLRPEERREFADGIVRLGIAPTLRDWVSAGDRIHALDTMGHNWWSACVFTAGIGALAVLDEEPRAAGWLREISDGSVEWFAYAGSLIENKPANFDAAGGFYESVNYAAFALAEYLQFRLAWVNALSTPPVDLPVLPRALEFFLHVSYPNHGPMMTLNFGDGSLHADGSRALALGWALGEHSPALAWYLNAARTMSYREGLDRSSALGLLYFPSDRDLAQAPALPPLPLAKRFPGMGWATFRSSWQKDATLLGIKSGYTWNHSHADAGSFILFHRGENLLIDSGNCSYARPEYDDYYRQSTAHNVVLFDGLAENPEDTYTGSKFSGSVSHLIDVPGFRYVLADATGPTSREFNRNYRHFLWVGDVILIVDDVEAFRPGRFSWLLHTGAPAVRRGLDLVVTRGEATVRVRPLFPETFPDAGLPTDYPEKLRLTELSGYQDHDPDVRVPYYAFQAAEATRKTKFITAITLVTPENETALPQLERLESKDALGVRIRQGGAVTEVWFNLLADGRIRHRNANNVLGGWETDALLLARSYPEGADGTDPAAATRTLVIDGSYVRHAGRVLLASLSKVFATWSEGPDGLDVVLQGQPVMNVALRAKGTPKRVLVNGREGTASVDAADQTVRIRSRP